MCQLTASGYAVLHGVGVGNGDVVFGTKGVEDFVEGSIVGTEEDEGATLACDERKEGAVIVAFVESSDNEYHGGGLCIEGYVAGIDIGGFGVVDVVDAVEGAYTL